MTSGRAKATSAIEEQLKATLAQYNTGLEVTEVTLQPAKPPEAVTAAFDDAIKAREDEVRYINQAKAYMRKVIPQARGKAARIEQEANAYHQKVVLNAQADIAPYIALLPQHKRAPQITDFRLYVSAFEHVFANVHKMLLDGDNKANLMFLPLDKEVMNRLSKNNAALSPILEAAQKKEEVSLAKAHDFQHRNGYSTPVISKR